MSSLAPRSPGRPLHWPDWLYDLQDALLADLSFPVYIVGGAVRDAYLRQPIKDLDLCTPGSAVSIARKIANHYRGDVYVLDAERDVARVLLQIPDGQRVIDLARFRGADLLADLTDRDFTMNAMAVDFSGDLTLLIDPLNGEKDLAGRVLRPCSPSAMADDPIRTLRAIRLSVQLQARIEPALVQALRATAPFIMTTSAERVRDEFCKLLMLPRPAAALRVADAVGLLREIIPEVAPLHGQPQSHANGFDTWQHTLTVVERMRGLLTTISPARNDGTAAVFDLGMMVMALDKHRGRLQTHLQRMWSDGRSHELLLILAALLHDIAKPKTAVQTPEGQWQFPGHADLGEQMVLDRLAALRFSNEEKARVAALTKGHMHRIFWDALDDRALHRFWRGVGEAGVDLCLFVLADYLGANTHALQQDEWLRLVERVRLVLDAYYNDYDRLVAPPPLLDGNTLMTYLGLPPGPIIGQLLEIIREAQAVGEVRTLDEALEAARAFLRASAVIDPHD